MLLGCYECVSPPISILKLNSYYSDMKGWDLLESQYDMALMNGFLPLRMMLQMEFTVSYFSFLKCDEKLPLPSERCSDSGMLEADSSPAQTPKVLAS